MFKFDYLDFTRLLQARKYSQSTSTFCVFPSELQSDFSAMLFSQNVEVPPNYQFDESLLLSVDIFTQTPWEEKVRQVQQFITEHIIELSQVSIENSSIENFANSEYRTFITSQEETPSKVQDLFFHFHMLHTYSFFQDCNDIAGFMKNHYLRYGDQQNATVLDDGFSFF